MCSLPLPAASTKRDWSLWAEFSSVCTCLILLSRFSLNFLLGTAPANDCIPSSNRNPVFSNSVSAKLEVQTVSHVSVGFHVVTHILCANNGTVNHHLYIIKPGRLKNYCWVTLSCLWLFILVPSAFCMLQVKRILVSFRFK